MDNSKSMKFNLNKLFLKITSLVVTGLFLFNIVFIDFALLRHLGFEGQAWAKADSFLRVPVDEGIREEIGNRLGLKSSAVGSPATLFRILTHPEYKEKEVSLETLREETKKLFKPGTKKAKIGLSAKTIENDMQILRNAGLVIRENRGGKITFRLNLEKERIEAVQKILDDEYQRVKVISKTASEEEKIIEKLSSFRGKDKETAFPRGKRNDVQRSSRLTGIDYQIMIMTNEGRTLHEIAKELGKKYDMVRYHRWMIIAKLEGKKYNFTEVLGNAEQIKNDMKKGIKNLEGVTDSFSSLLEKPKDKVSEEVQVFWGKMGEIKAVRRQGEYAETGQQSESEAKKRTEKIEQNLSEFAKVCPDIKLLDKLRAEIMASLKDPDNRRALIINHRLIREPGFALGLYKIVEQLGWDEERGLRLVLSYNAAEEGETVDKFYEKIEEASGIDLSEDFFDKVVSAEEEKKPGEVINKLVQELDVESIMAFGPGDWVKMYKEVKGPESLKHIIGVVCELGDNNSIIRVGTAFDTALEAYLIAEDLLDSGKVKHGDLYNKDKGIFEITELQEVTKEHKDYIENGRDITGAN